MAEILLPCIDCGRVAPADDQITTKWTKHPEAIIGLCYACAGYGRELLSEMPRMSAALEKRYPEAIYG